MPLRRRKNRTGLRATLRLPVCHIRDRKGSGYDDGARRHYYRVYLWEDAESAQANIDGAGTGACGWHCTAPTWIKIAPDGTETVRPPAPLLGELHFVAGRWNTEIAVHELQHAQLNLQRLWPHVAALAMEQEPMEAEEFLCYRFGRMFDVLYGWLWDQDPPARDC